MPVIPGTPGAKTEGRPLRGLLGKLVRPYLKNFKMGWSTAHGRAAPIKPEALDSIHSTNTTNQTKGHSTR